MQPALVDPLALAEREEVELVVVVGDERDVRLDAARPSTLIAERRVIACEQGERAQAGEGLAPAAVGLASVRRAARRAPSETLFRKARAVDAADVDPTLVSVR